MFTATQSHTRQTAMEQAYKASWKRGIGKRKGEEEEEREQNRAIPLTLPWPTGTCFL